MSVAKVESTIPAIDIPLPCFCVEIPTTPRTKLKAIKTKAPIYVSLSQLPISRHASRTKIPKIIDGTANQYPLPDSEVGGFWTEWLYASSKTVFFSLNSASLKMPFSFNVDNFSICSKN